MDPIKAIVKFNTDRNLVKYDSTTEYGMLFEELQEFLLASAKRDEQEAEVGHDDVAKLVAYLLDVDRMPRSCRVVEGSGARGGYRAQGVSCLATGGSCAALADPHRCGGGGDRGGPLATARGGRPGPGAGRQGAHLGTPQGRR